jgi:hypothetical protein
VGDLDRVAALQLHIDDRLFRARLQLRQTTQCEDHFDAKNWHQREPLVLAVDYVLICPIMGTATCASPRCGPMCSKLHLHHQRCNALLSYQLR